jgi:uncharacterized tellurite resistance protein B-like protein
MLDRLIDFLGRFETRPDATGNLTRNDPRVAAAALMYHVMDADGVRQDVEMERLGKLLAEAYSLDPDELRRISAAGQDADRDAVDLYSFTSVLNRHLDMDAKHELIELLWEIVYADNNLHELEDSVVWRVAELIHVEARDRVALRQRVEARRTLP